MQTQISVTLDFRILAMAKLLKISQESYYYLSAHAYMS